MSVCDEIGKLDLAALKILRYPDPRLLRPSEPIDRFDLPLRRLIDRMFELLFQAPGVGLAAAQVGVNATLFVASPTCQEDDRQIYINPRIISTEGNQDEEEGCLSMPGITCRIKRPNVITIKALDIEGREFTQTGRLLSARIFQHEMDHLDGRLILHRMGSIARMANRRAIQDLKEQFHG